MQARPHSNQQVSSKQRRTKIAMYTLVCFALAGLIAGFAFGGFLGNISKGSTASLNRPVATSPVIAQHSAGISPTPTPENVFIDPPSITKYSSQETADNTTSYTLSAQIIDKTTHQPIQTTDVVCKLWLTSDNNATSQALNANKDAIPAAVTSLSQPFPHETQGALNFTTPSKQVQPCVAKGLTTWTYTLSSSVQSGTYFLGVLADWKGTHYNWYFVQISVPKNS